MNFLSKIFNKSTDEDPLSSENQAKVLGNLSNEEKQDMIQGIEDLSETSVKEVMIPRIDVDFIPLEISQDELLEKITTSGHSRFPVFSESIDNVVGILYVKDLINLFSKKEAFNLASIIRKPFFVPETKRIDTLLREFKRRHVHIAIAIDEYGGTSGIVSMEDIIEQIVGDIQDEFDNEAEDILQISENIWLCDARINIEDLNETIEANIPNEEFDTLGGFVFELFGKIPSKFEKATWKEFDFIVQDVEGHRINQIKIIKRNEKSED